MYLILSHKYFFKSQLLKMKYKIRPLSIFTKKDV